MFLLATGDGHHVGDKINILNHTFRICGIVENGKGGRKLVPIETLGELIGSDGKATVLYLKSDNPANQDAIRKEIAAAPGLQNYNLQTMEDLISLYTPSRFPGFDLALNVVISIAVIVGILVIFQSMYTAVLERTREIGILKSMGAAKAAIVGMVLRETAVLAVAGVLVGIAATLWRAGAAQRQVSRFQLRTDSGLDRQGRSDRLGQLRLRGTLPGVDGRSQGSDRRAGLRIGRTECRAEKIRIAVRMDKQASCRS